VLLQSDQSSCTTEEKDSDKSGKHLMDVGYGQAQMGYPSAAMLGSGKMAQHEAIDDLPIVLPTMFAGSQVDLDLLQDSYLDDLQPVHAQAHLLLDPEGGGEEKARLESQPHFDDDSVNQTGMFDDIFSANDQADGGTIVVQSNEYADGWELPCAVAPECTSFPGKTPGCGEYAEGLLNSDAMLGSAYRSENSEGLIGFSTKLYECTPGDLTDQMKPSLQQLVGTSSMEGYMRPGCVHIQLDAILDTSKRDNSKFREYVRKYLDGMSESSVQAPDNMVFQCGSTMAIVKDGKIMQMLRTTYAGELLPSLSSVNPLAAKAPAHGELHVKLWGRGIRQDDTILARSKGGSIVMFHSCMYSPYVYFYITF